ncbi:hypothetical protein JTE90_028978 [Oedothorax gibbosus]|uniref:Uncharacterized protein n=1 Tax=Oedothorax gibbosus TaxID=931172 RepID=A0AAV6VJY8_9ARAC|nr:hypothetical protein JTE90_028978 [Oedothorax gibbosus]
MSFENVEYHVTYGACKKIVKTESNVCKDICGSIKKCFSLDPEGSLHLQYWNAKYQDWADCEESDEVNEDSINLTS